MWPREDHRASLVEVRRVSPPAEEKGTWKDTGGHQANTNLDTKLKI